MKKYTKEDIFQMVEEDDVEFIRLQFTAAAHMLDAILLGCRKLSAVDIPKGVFIINYFRRNRP